MKKTKWRIGLVEQLFYLIDCEGDNVEEAIENAMNEYKTDDEEMVTSSALLVTSILINDRESRDFFVYVPEKYPNENNKT